MLIYIYIYHGLCKCCKLYERHLNFSCDSIFLIQYTLNCFDLKKEPWQALEKNIYFPIKTDSLTIPLPYNFRRHRSLRKPLFGTLAVFNVWFISCVHRAAKYSGKALGFEVRSDLILCDVSQSLHSFVSGPSLPPVNWPTWANNLTFLFIFLISKDKNSGTPFSQSCFTFEISS